MNSNHSELLSFLHKQIHAREILGEYIHKAESMVQVAMTDDFSHCAQATIHSYLWALIDLIATAKNLNDESLNLLVKECYGT